MERVTRVGLRWGVLLPLAAEGTGGICRADEDLVDLVPSLVPRDRTLPGPPVSHDPSVFHNNPRTTELALGVDAHILSLSP